MTKKKSRLLYEKFSFLNPADPPRDRPKSFYFECYDGWYKLLLRLCNDIQNKLDREPEEVRNEFRVVQVKSKFAGLRFYVTGGTDEIHKIIEKAESDSYGICEICGKRGGLEVLSGWDFTLCGRCFKDNARKVALEERRELKRRHTVQVET